MGVDYRKQYRQGLLEPFFPNEIIKMIIVVLCTVALLMFMVVLPTVLEHIGLHGIAHEEDPADPGTTPAHIRPEWYFLAVYQYLKLMPAEIFGVSGKALGILSQAVIGILWFLVPFWYPLKAANLESNKWRLGLFAFVIQFSFFLISSAVLYFIRKFIPPPFNDIIHPMFVWPVMWVAGFIVAVLAAGKILMLNKAFEWLRLLNTGFVLIGIQFMAFIIVLGQGLSWAINPVIAYLIGYILFIIASIFIIKFIKSRIEGNDEKSRLKMMTSLIIEGIILFLALTVWAMWPHEGLLSSPEKGEFLFSASVITFTVAALYTFLIIELRTLSRVMAPEDRDKLT